MRRHILTLLAGAVLSTATVGARADEGVLPPVPAPPAGHSHLIPIVIGAVAGAYLWPLLLSAASEAVVTSAGASLGSAAASVAALPAAAVESAGVPVAAVALPEAASSWPVTSWYPAVLGALQGAYTGYLFSR